MPSLGSSRCSPEFPCQAGPLSQLIRKPNDSYCIAASQSGRCAQSRLGAEGATISRTGRQERATAGDWYRRLKEDLLTRRSGSTCDRSGGSIKPRSKKSTVSIAGPRPGPVVSPARGSTRGLPFDGEMHHQATTAITQYGCRVEDLLKGLIRNKKLAPAYRWQSPWRQADGSAEAALLGLWLPAPGSRETIAEGAGFQCGCGYRRSTY